MSDPSTAKRKDPSDFSLSKYYLTLYNSVLVIGWSLVMVRGYTHVCNTRSFDGLYQAVEPWLKISQTAAIMEIMHSAIRIVSSKVMTVLPQVFSRLAILWIIVDPFMMADPHAAKSIGFPLLLIAWTVTEIVRYSFYCNQLLGTGSYGLTWCRYSFFIILYPIGVTGELLCLFASMPIMKSTRKYDISLPNVFNFSLSFVHIAYGCVLLYPQGLYGLYTYMLKQRRKVLGALNEEKDD